MIDNIELIIVFSILIFTLYRKRCHLQKLYSDKLWFINIFIIILFSLYIFNKDWLYTKLNVKMNDTNMKEIRDKNVVKTQKQAIKKAIFALLIAILAYMDLTIAPFWLVYFVYVNLGDEWLA